MTLAAVEAAAQAVGLALRGGLHDPEGAPDGTRTLLLMGPDEPAFWPIFAASPEYADGLPDPMDRWSKRVLSALARQLEGAAIFPSDGPPYPPFLSWARQSGHAWQSPVGLLVHDVAGLFISYRGALALPRWLDLPPMGASPCTDCPAPCLTACPVGALNATQVYDVPACKAHVGAEAGRGCRDGCLVRRACPASLSPATTVTRGFRRLPVQSAFHMQAFMTDCAP